MRRLALLMAVLLITPFILQASNGAGPGPRIGGAGPQARERGPRPSGFHRFRSAVTEFNGGVGIIPGLTCSIDEATQPAAYAGNMLVDCDAEIPHNETTIAVDPGNPDHAIGGYHAQLISFKGGTAIGRTVGATSVTFDRGKSWREIIPPIRPYQFTGDPALAFDSRGGAYFALIADHEGPGGNYTGPDVIVSRSRDGGLTWDPPVTVADGATAITNGKFFGPNIFNDKEFIAADTGAASPWRDRVHVTWSRFEEFFSPRRGFFRVPIVVSSSDGGSAWSAPREISGFNPDLCQWTYTGTPGECDLNQDSYPAVAPDGTVYVGFENFNSLQLNQILVVSSADGGATWSGPAHVDFVQDLNFPPNALGDDTLTGCQFRMSVRANTATAPDDPTGRTVYVVWADNRHGTFGVDPGGNLVYRTNTDVFLGRSIDGGRTWAVIPVDLSANDQFYPWVAVGPGGRVDIGYMDRSYSDGQEVCQYGFSLTRLTISASGVVTASQKMRVDTGLSDPGHSRWYGPNALFIGDYNGIAVGPDGATWSLWTDMRAPAGLTTDRHGQHAVAAITD